MKKIFTSFFLLSAMTMGTLWAQEAEDVLAENDLNAPFGWVTCASLSGGTYEATGGNAVSNPKSITLQSNGAGKDMRTAITNAIKNYQIIILDGSNGDFEISKKIELTSLSNKTIVGINGARICTQFYVTDEIKALLDSKNVLSASTSSGTGGTLSNGTSVSEEREYLTRQALIDYTGDKTEAYRHAGVIYLSKCTNIIFRNLQFVGPGPVDVGGYDCMSCLNSKHVWVDHCDFTDGLDGNFDITSGADFVTCSWCTFSYTERAYDHKNTNLVGSSDSESSGLNVTYAFCEWGSGCNARMPMARFGMIHLLNNYYNCAGNGSPAINPRKNSKFLIEGNYFEKGVKKIFSQSDAQRWTWTMSNYAVESFAASNYGTTVVMPYTYAEMGVQSVPSIVGEYAGATLSDPLILGRATDIRSIESVSPETETPTYNLRGQRVPANSTHTFLIRDGKIRIMVK
ncbi:MAG: hypothetical protein IJP70_11215 [Bacteroidales bacterium]|nr:hypothetical protein [Bacteroidales bacterium]